MYQSSQAVLTAFVVQAGNGDAAGTPRPFQPKETLLFIRLVKWAMQALDVYTLNVSPLAPGAIPLPPGASRPANMPQVRTKEEKEVLEHFAGVVSAFQVSRFEHGFFLALSYSRI